MSKHDSEFASEIKQFLGERRPAKLQKGRQRFAEALKHTPARDRVEMVHRICHELHLAVRTKSVVGREDDVYDSITDSLLNRHAMERVEDLIKHLSQMLFEEGDLPTCMGIFTFITKKDAMTFPDTTEGKSLAMRVSLLNKLLQAFMEEAGSTEEKSLRFGILLCESWETYESQLHARLLERASADEKVDMSLSGMPALYLLLTAVTGVWVHTQWMNTWFENIVRVAHKTQVGSDVLQSLLNVLTTFSPRPTLEVLEVLVSEETPAVEPTPAEAEASTAKKRTHPHYADGLASVFTKPIILRPEIHELFHAWSTRKRIEQQRARADGDRALQRFIQEKETTMRLMNERSQKILKEPRRGLRPAGYDHIEVQVSALRNVGIRGVIFRPEGFTFPDVGIEIVARRDTPTLRVYKTELRKFMLDLTKDEVVCWKEHFEHRFDLVCMLDFVVVDMLYRIVASSQELREKRNWQETGDVLSAHTPSNIPVRPLLRRLPEGFKATERAQQLAEREMGWQLRPGMTFVSAHVRHGQLEYDLPTRPTAIYTDEDLLSEIA